MKPYSYFFSSLDCWNVAHNLLRTQIAQLNYQNKLPIIFMFSMMLVPSLVDLILVLGKSLNMQIEAENRAKITFKFLIIKVFNVIHDCLDRLFFWKTDQIGSIIRIKYFLFDKSYMKIRWVLFAFQIKGFIFINSLREYVWSYKNLLY